MFTKICTQDVNTSIEEQSCLITVKVLALKLNANVILVLANVKIVPQSYQFFEKHSN